MKITLTLLSITLTLFSITRPVVADSTGVLSGYKIMQEVYQRHEQFPYIYEEQVMVLIDSAGHRDTRKLRRYSRLGSADSGRYLLLFDAPPEVRGVGLLTTIQPSGEIQAGIYLPAYGPILIESVGQNQSDTFLGTDFSVNDLIPEPLDKYQFERVLDERVDGMNYFVIDVYNKHADIRTATAKKRHHVRQDNYYITRTDTFDRHGRMYKRQTHHDLKSLGGKMWRADMILMEDLKAHHKTLIKIARRIFSRDYVPEELFTLSWLVNNKHMAPKEDEPGDNSRNISGEMDVSQTTEGLH